MQIFYAFPSSLSILNHPEICTKMFLKSGIRLINSHKMPRAADILRSPGPVFGMHLHAALQLCPELLQGPFLNSGDIPPPLMQTIPKSP